MLAVGLLFGVLGYLWSEDFGAALGVWALLVASFIDPQAGKLRRAMRRRVAQTPVSLIAQVRSGQIVAVEGCVVAEAGTLEIPLLGGACVWLRVAVLEQVARGSGRYRRSEWVVRHARVQQRPFHLDDRSGRIARVELGEVIPVTDTRSESIGLFDSATPAERQLLAAAGVESTTSFGMNRTLRIEVSALHVGHAAYACGIARRAGSDAPLVLQAADGDPVGVILGSGDRAAMLKRLRTWKWI